VSPVIDVAVRELNLSKNKINLILDVGHLLTEGQLFPIGRGELDALAGEVVVGVVVVGVKHCGSPLN
jgi:hypothetical protein